MSSPLCRLVACVVIVPPVGSSSSHRCLVSFPVSPRHAACLARRLCLTVISLSSSRAICLFAALRPALRPVSRLASRLVLRLAAHPAAHPVLPWVMSSPPYPIAPRAVRLAVINRPAMLVEGRGAEQDGTPLSPSLARLAAVACLGIASRLRAFPRCGLLCLLGRRVDLCLYYDGVIVYMICPIAII